MPTPRDLYPKELWGELHARMPEVYPALTTEEHQEIESKKIRERYAKIMTDMVQPYSVTERETWPTQVAEANKYLADPNADTPLIDALAKNRKMPIDELVRRIKNNENQYRVAVGTLLGMQQRELDELYNPPQGE